MVLARNLFFLSVPDHVVNRADGLKVLFVFVEVIASPFFRAAPKFYEHQLCYLNIFHVRLSIRVFKIIAYDLFDEDLI